MKSKPIKEQRLDALERDFLPLLISCLEKSRNGRWGLFGQNDGVDMPEWIEHWEDGQRLKEMALQIRDLRTEFGQPNLLVERFLHYCSLRGPNIPGEPKLAQALLEEIQKDQLKST